MMSGKRQRRGSTGGVMDQIVVPLSQQNFIPAAPGLPTAQKLGAYRSYAPLGTVGAAIKGRGNYSRRRLGLRRTRTKTSRKKSFMRFNFNTQAGIRNIMKVRFPNMRVSKAFLQEVVEYPVPQRKTIVANSILLTQIKKRKTVSDLVEPGSFSMGRNIISGELSKTIERL